jgi:predicted aspartyl protease
LSFRVSHMINDADQCALQVVVVSPFGIHLPQKTKETWAIMDTGSPATIIDRKVVEEIGLPISDENVPIILASSPEPVECDKTYADLVFKGNDRRSHTFHIDMIIAPGGLRHRGVLLGMDAFEGGRVQIDFTTRMWSFSVPPGFGDGETTATA